METIENNHHHSHSHGHRHEKHRSENVHVYQVDAIVGKNPLNIAFTAAVLGQLLFFFANYSISAALGSDGEVFVLIAHFLRAFGEGFLLFCLMKGMASLLYPLKWFFISAIFFFVLFHLVTSVLMIMHQNGLLGDIGVFFYLLSSITYFALGFMLKQKYKDSLAKLGIIMMTYVIVSLALSLAGMMGINIYIDFACVALGVYYIITLRDRFDVDYDD
ncbi:MAG: hypothetical protein IJL54_04700 [Prevotella sp.]|nr:hypothetical protein [Prevotella sp.]